MSFRGFCWMLFGLIPVYLVLAAVVPVFDDELYYWCWSQELQLSYYDHPPMVAYMIRVTTELLGNSILAIRLPGVFSGLAVVGVVGYLSHPRTLLPLILLSPAITFGAVMVTPDTPMLLFWALYLVWLVKVHEQLGAESRPRAPVWLLGGLILGCGGLGKYTMGLAAIAGSVSFLVAGNWRRWLPGYVLHALTAILVASPILIHNLQHDFVPLRYQWGHSMGSPQPGFGPFAEFIGGQILLFGLVPFAVFVWALVHRRELLADPRLRVCWCLFVLPFAFFLFKATRGRLEGNWAFPAYIACWPLAAEWFRRAAESGQWRWGRWAGFAIPAAVTVFLVFHAISPVSLLSARADRATRQREKLALADATARDLRASGYQGRVYTPTYQWVALLRWHGVDAHQLPGVTRPSHFTERGTVAANEPYLLFTEAEDPERAATLVGAGTVKVIAEYQLAVHGHRLASFWVLDCADTDCARIGTMPTARLDQTPQLTPR